MGEEKCSHLWEMVNVAAGMIVMKQCFHCGKVSSCFCFHNKPPLEECHEQQHFWNFMEDDESFHFDLRCTKCGTVVMFDELVCLMRCTGCDEKCRVCIFKRSLEPEEVQVYIAMGRRPVEERRQLSQEQFWALEAFFNQQSESLKRQVKIVRHEMVKDVDKCYAEVIRDVDMLFAASDEVN